jgi:hypothetical protein
VDFESLLDFALLLAIHVDDNGCNDDHALDDLLVIRIDPQVNCSGNLSECDCQGGAEITRTFELYAKIE